jgi:hypothetical protein
MKTNLKHYSVREIVEGLTCKELEGKGANIAKNWGVSQGRCKVGGGECERDTGRTYW